MVKWIFILVFSVIAVSIIAYRLFLYTPLHTLDKESQETAVMGQNPDNFVSYIVTTEKRGGVTMHTIDSLSADRNYTFTGRNLSVNFQKN